MHRDSEIVITRPIANCFRSSPMTAPRSRLRGGNHKNGSTAPGAMEGVDHQPRGKSRPRQETQQEERAEQYWCRLELMAAARQEQSKQEWGVCVIYAYLRETTMPRRKKEPTSGSERPAGTSGATPLPAAYGSSLTAGGISPQDALMAKIKSRKSPCTTHRRQIPAPPKAPNIEQIDIATYSPSMLMRR